MIQQDRLLDAEWKWWVPFLVRFALDASPRLGSRHAQPQAAAPQCKPDSVGVYHDSNACSDKKSRDQSFFVDERNAPESLPFSTKPTKNQMITTIAKFTCSLCLLGASVTSANAAFTLYSFQAGLTNITDASGLSRTGATGASYLTDNSTSTGVLNVGTSGGSLAGNFGGGSSFNIPGADILIVGAGNASQTAWSSFTVSLLLSDGSLTPGMSFDDTDVLATGSSETMTFAQEDYAHPISAVAPAFYYYLPLEITDFNTGGLGVTGIALTGLSFPFPDITYIGVVVPEPSSTAFLGLAALGGLFGVRRRS